MKEWENHQWKALGIGIDGGFAIIWLGEETDPEKETIICGGETIIAQPVVSVQVLGPQIVNESTGRFYLIFGNYATMTEAKSVAAKYVKEGFLKAKVITKDDKFRISLNDYSTKELAVQGKKELPAKYKDAWIMPYLQSNETSLK
jgi:cell division protein FtsN